MRMGTARTPLRWTSHSEASSLPSSGSVKTLRLSVGCANAEPAKSNSRHSAGLAAATAAAPATATAARAAATAEPTTTAALEARARALLRGACLSRLPRLCLPIERVDRLAAGRVLRPSAGALVRTVERAGRGLLGRPVAADV